MVNTIKFKIVTPEKVIYEDEIIQVTIPTVDGEITVLANHIALISVLKGGEMKIKDKNGEHLMAIAGGFLEINGNNQIVILADHAERAVDIDLERAEQARVRALEQMEEAKDEENVDFAKLQAVIDREMNRIRIGKKNRSLPQAKQD